MNYTARILSIAVLPEGEAIDSEAATVIEITDEGGGEFISVIQHTDTDEQTIRLDPDEWPRIKDAIDTMVRQLTCVKT